MVNEDYLERFHSHHDNVSRESILTSINSFSSRGITESSSSISVSSPPRNTKTATALQKTPPPSYEQIGHLKQNEQIGQLKKQNEQIGHLKKPNEQIGHLKQNEQIGLVQATQIELFTVRALYDFTAEAEGEMSLCKGDTVRVTSQPDKGWWVGNNEVSGQSGLFPSNYVEKIQLPIEPVRGIKAISEKSQEPIRGIKMPAMPPASTKPKFNAVESTCKDCGCNEFAANVFKAAQCNNCFHLH